MYKIGYTQGVFDMFHIGHLNLINNSKKNCEYLIVGVNTDDLVKEYKNKLPVVNENNRMEIVKNIKAVDQCVLVSTLDKTELFKKFNFDVVFIGDDWKDNLRWKQTEMDLKKYNVDVIYLPYTPEISSTNLRGEINNSVRE